VILCGLVTMATGCKVLIKRNQFRVVVIILLLDKVSFTMYKRNVHLAVSQFTHPSRLLRISALLLCYNQGDSMFPVNT
jgi:hypothetical protein